MNMFKILIFCFRISSFAAKQKASLILHWLKLYFPESYTCLQKPLSKLVLETFCNFVSSNLRFQAYRSDLRLLICFFPIGYERFKMET